MRTLRLLRNLAALFILGVTLLAPRPAEATEHLTVPCKLMPWRACSNTGWALSYGKALYCAYRAGYNCI